MRKTVTEAVHERALSPRVQGKLENLMQKVINVKPEHYRRVVDEALSAELQAGVHELIEDGPKAPACRRPLPEENNYERSLRLELARELKGVGSETRVLLLFILQELRSRGTVEEMLLNALDRGIGREMPWLLQIRRDDETQKEVAHA